MKALMVFTAGVLFVCMAHVVVGERPEKERGQELAALEQKLLGVWKGQTGCAGNFRFRADGSYELTEYGPGAGDSAGSWKVRWDALPPTLVLTCKTSGNPEEVGKTTEAKLIQLDQKSLGVKHANPDDDRYARVKD